MQKPKQKRIMILALTEGRMTISIDFGSEDENKITAEDVLLGAYDIISRIFSQKALIRAYQNTDPETMTILKNPNSGKDDTDSGTQDND